MYLVKFIKKIFRIFGFEINRLSSKNGNLPDIEPGFLQTYKKVEPYTMTSPERIYSLCEAVKYLSDNDISGDIVECGVWKGGSMMAVAETLLSTGDMSRNLYLFDTFEGMVQPSVNDVDIYGVTAEKLFKKFYNVKGKPAWCYAGIEIVKKALNSTGYPDNKIHFIKGMVENTIPSLAPDNIALLRLDTDWYESTKHELEHLFKRLTKGGVLIIDDYGHWKGARKAVDEYFTNNNIKILLNRIDYSGRIAVKM